MLQVKVKYKEIKSSYGWEFHWFPIFSELRQFMSINVVKLQSLLLSLIFISEILCLIYH